MISLDVGRWRVEKPHGFRFSQGLGLLPQGWTVEQRGILRMFSRIAVAGWLSGISLVAFAWGTAGAQSPAYDVLPMAPEYVLPALPDPLVTAADRAAKKKHSEVTSLIKSARSRVQDVLRGSAARDAAFDAFFSDYVFPSMAQSDDATTSQLGQLRQEFLKSYLSVSTAQNRTLLIESVTLPVCRKLATGNYHPSVRLNAVYLAGQLEDRDASGITNQAPAPNRQAAAFLSELCTSADTPPYLIAAAVGGLMRIAEIEGVESHQIDLSGFRNYCFSVLKSAAPGQADWDPDFAYWMRKRAVESLGHLRDPAALADITALVADASGPFLIRLSATQAIAQLNLASADASSVNAASMAVVGFVHDSLAAEAVGIRATIEDLVAVNLLWNDRYLIDPGFVSPTDENQGGGGGGDEVGGLGGGQGLGAGRGGEGGDGRGGGGGGRGGESGGGGGAQNPQAVVKKVKSWREFDLPQYHLNMVRQRCKLMLYISQTALNALAATNRLSGDVKPVLDKSLRVINTVLSEANEGLVDLGAKVPDKPPVVDPREADKPKTSTTVKLMEGFQTRADEIKALLPPADAGQPAATPAGAAAPTAAGAGS